MAEDSGENNRLSARLGPVSAASVRCREAQQESVNRIGSTLATNGGSLVRNRPASRRIIPAAEQLIRRRGSTDGGRSLRIGRRAKMVSSRWFRSLGLAVVAGVLLAPSPGFAKINQAGLLLV